MKLDEVLILILFLPYWEIKTLCVEVGYPLPRDWQSRDLGTRHEIIEWCVVQGKEESFREALNRAHTRLDTRVASATKALKAEQSAARKKAAQESAPK